MPGYRALDRRMMRSVAFVPEDPAVRITDAILMSRGQSNSCLIASDGGDVVVNTGTVMEAERHRERYEQLLGRDELCWLAGELSAARAALEPQPVAEP